MIRKRDMYLCQVCLRQGIYNCSGIEVHHAVKIGEDKELTFESSNLITLCREHHQMADEGKITLKEIKEIIEEQEVNKDIMKDQEMIKDTIERQEAMKNRSKSQEQMSNRIGERERIKEQISEKDLGLFRMNSTLVGCG